MSPTEFYVWRPNFAEVALAVSYLLFKPSKILDGEFNVNLPRLDQIKQQSKHSRRPRIHL